MDNYLGIDRNEWPTPIYRFTTVERLLQLLVHSQNTLVSPRKWKDPFENILSRLPCRKIDGALYWYELRNRVYGQCWTLVEESDCTWRMYVPNENGVRLKTTIRNLHQSLNNSLDSNNALSCFIGRVDYVNEDDLITRLSDRNWNKEHFLGQGSKGQAESLLFKREAFLHEQEIRLIYLEPQNRGRDDFFTYHIDMSNFIEEIMFDPRMKDSLYDTYYEIVCKYGFRVKLGNQRCISCLCQISLFNNPMHSDGNSAVLHSRR